MLGNWIVQTTTSTGTGNLALSPVTGYPPISSQFAVAQILSYTILDDATGAPLERGLGSINGSGELVRTKPLASMVAGSYDGSDVAAVSIPAGTKRVICTPGANGFYAVPGMWSGGGQAAYSDANPAGGVSNTAIVADTVYILPFIHSVDADVVEFRFRMAGTTAAAGKLAKIAAFSIGLNGLPDVKLAESPAVAVDSTGIKVCSVTRFRPPSHYYVALLSDGAPQVQYVAGSLTNVNHALGFTGTFAAIGHMTQAGATGLNFPSSWSPTGVVGTANRPQILAVCG